MIEDEKKSLKLNTYPFIDKHIISIFANNEIFLKHFLIIQTNLDVDKVELLIPFFVISQYFFPSLPLLNWQLNRRKSYANLLISL